MLDEGHLRLFSQSELHYGRAGRQRAEKANLKRAHFALSELYPHDAGQFERGMASFKASVTTQAEELMETVKGRGSLVRVWFGKEGDDHGLLRRVQQRGAAAPRGSAVPATSWTPRRHRIRNVQDVLRSETRATGEGGGLGLLVTVLMLRKIGLDESFLRLATDDEGTTTKIIMPPRAGKEEELVAEAAALAIGHIPQFPEHVLEILHILDDPAKSFGDIAPIVSQDSNLIAELLKTANASVYGLPRSVQTIEQAVAVLGLPALQKICSSPSSPNGCSSTQVSLPAVRTITTQAIEGVVVLPRARQKSQAGPRVLGRVPERHAPQLR